MPIRSIGPLPARFPSIKFAVQVVIPERVGRRQSGDAAANGDTVSNAPQARSGSRLRACPLRVQLRPIALVREVARQRL
jgi:hypothetical protein